MWLLNVNTQQLEVFEGDRIPRYAILSHRWETLEAPFEDVRTGKLNLDAYPKVVNCCRQAVTDGLTYVWIDTCCIDKRSSAELSEAINSMYQWYQRSSVCYAYLSDVDGSESDITNSLWFTRGWTLQELLAPAKLRFYDASWTFRGTKADHAKRILTRWRIPVAALLSFSPSQWSIAERMSWASYRETTRTEDSAYCLLGLFNVNMPLLYGEGHKAFQRLQENLMSISNDLSIFAYSNNPEPSFSMLAEFPSSFLGTYIVKRSEELSGEIPDYIGFDEKPYSFIQQNSPYVIMKEGIEATLQLHHYIFNIYCFRLGSIRFLRNKGIGKRFQLPRLDLYAFLEYDPVRNKYRRVTLDGSTCIARAVSRRLRTRTVRCIIEREPLQDISSMEFERSQLARILHRRELRGFAYIASGCLSDAGVSKPDSTRGTSGLISGIGQGNDSSPFAYDGHCFGLWYDAKVSVMSAQPAVIIHFGFDFEDQPVVLLSVPSDKCQWKQMRDVNSRILGQDHVCCADGCATGLKRGLPTYLLIKILRRFWPRREQNTTIEEWQATKSESTLSQAIPTISIEGIGQVFQYTTSSQEPEPKKLHHAIFDFSHHINGLEMLPSSWVARRSSATTSTTTTTATNNTNHQNHQQQLNNTQFEQLHNPPRTKVRRTAALLFTILTLLACITLAATAYLLQSTVEMLGNLPPLASLLLFLYAVSKIYSPLPNDLSLSLLETRVIEILWDLALY